MKINIHDYINVFKNNKIKKLLKNLFILVKMLFYYDSLEEFLPFNLYFIKFLFTFAYRLDFC